MRHEDILINIQNKSEMDKERKEKKNATYIQNSKINYEHTCDDSPDEQQLTATEHDTMGYGIGLFMAFEF